MHYYKFNIADWNLATNHLSLEEEAVYFKLVNYYYDTESPIPEETQMVIRRLRLGSHIKTVELILNEFFEFSDGSWHHARCDEELFEYQKKANNNRENGKKGGRPKKINDLDNNPEKTQMVSKNNPDITLTNNHKPLTINHKFIRPTLEELQSHIVEKGYAVDAIKFYAYYESNGWKVGKNPMKNWKSALITWNKSNLEKPAKKQEVRFGEWLGDEIFEEDLPQTKLIQVN